ncbi:MAG: zinc ribbon domain-containing protein [Deltaproteobacteria bacterium]|nr:zinc ribbon domain-containing protein [Deltaproteobacteria bacterium]
MPIYEYRCESCGSVSEYLVGMGNDEPIACRQCGSRDMNRILSASSFALQSSERLPGRTCCGREERCETPPCSTGGTCRREH